jgi:hypothetical protein
MFDFAHLDSSTIALLVRFFNIVSTVILACLAIYGLVVIVRRKYGAKFLSAFCVASLLAFAVEIVFFNYEHYLKWFAGEEFYMTDIPSQNPTIHGDGVTAEILAYANGEDVIEYSIIFKNINRKVTSVFIQPLFNKYELLNVKVRWKDESATFESVEDFQRTLYKALPHENHIAIGTCGNVSELEIIFPKQTLFEEISQITVNKQIPFYFSGLRLFVVSLLFFAIILFVYKPLRAKTAYYLFEYKFNPANRKQTIVYVCLVVLTLLFVWLCDYTSLMGDKDNRGDSWVYMLNKYLVDAFIDGRMNIDLGYTDKLLNAEQPYNHRWLAKNGYKNQIDYSVDVSYYKGKFYCYYGVVPVVFLFLPYKLLTGNYLSYSASMFVTVSIAVIFLALLWRFLVKKYMPNARFVFVQLSFLALFFVSFLASILRHSVYHNIVHATGIAFLYAGLLLLLKSVDKKNINLLQLFFACLCLALTVGCRADMVLASILVSAVLWKRRSWKLALFILIPYLMVAIPLCAYNYVRFDSIFELGHKYCIGNDNASTGHLMNPLAKIHRSIVVFILYLFRLYNYSLHFPYIELRPPILLSRWYTCTPGFALVYNYGGGLINYPILFCIIYLFKNIQSKNKPNGFYLQSVFLAIAAAMIFTFSKMGIFHERYLSDCAIFFTLPSLFCAYYWCGYKRYVNADGLVSLSEGDQNATCLKIIYVLLAVSIFIGLFRFVVGDDPALGRVAMNYDPALYRYLEYSLGIVRRLL